MKKIVCLLAAAIITSQALATQHSIITNNSANDWQMFSHENDTGNIYFYSDAGRNNCYCSIKSTSGTCSIPAHATVYLNWTTTHNDILNAFEFKDTNNLFADTPYTVNIYSAQDSNGGDDNFLNGPETAAISINGWDITINQTTWNGN